MNKPAYIASGIIINALRFALALVFAFSGFVKAVDPMGTVHKLTDYSEVFGWGVHPALLLVGTWALIGLEYVIGVSLFFGFYRRFYLWLTIVFLVVMTPLTLWLALNNPISDCGCFGDALVLTHWQTFGKNVVLLIMAVIVLKCYARVQRIISMRTQWLVFVYALLSIVLFMQYNLRHLPVWDFRPYAIGRNVIEDMMVPDDAPQNEYETLFVLEKEGEQRTFTFDNYPDSTWHLVRRESRLVSEGYVPPITDFSLFTLEGEEVTWEILEQPGYTFFLVARDLRRTNEGLLDVINELYDYAKVNGAAFYMVTASNMEAITKWYEHTGAAYPCLNADETLLKTVIRANTGLLALQDATIVGKWSAADLPRDEQLYTSLAHNDVLTITAKELESKRIMVVLCMFLPLVLLVVVDGSAVGVILLRKLKNKV